MKGGAAPCLVLSYVLKPQGSQLTASDESILPSGLLNMLNGVSTGAPWQLDSCA